jgi:hypothetical protein
MSGMEPDIAEVSDMLHNFARPGRKGVRECAVIFHVCGGRAGYFS